MQAALAAAETVGALPLTALSFPPWFPDAWQTCKAGKLAGGLKLGGARLEERLRIEFAESLSRMLL